MSQLVTRQDLFLQRACKVIEYARSLGYLITEGEAERTAEQAEIYAKQGKGILDSKHRARLAMDLNFYRDGKLVADRVSLEPIGVYAEKIGLHWGGRFKKLDDSRHFEE